MHLEKTPEWRVEEGLRPSDRRRYKTVSLVLVSVLLAIIFFIFADPTMVARESIIAAIVALLFSQASPAAGQACTTTTLQNTTPGYGNVALQSYSYCGGNLNATAYIHNDDYDKIVTIYYNDGTESSTPLSSVGLNYINSVGNTGWEVWGAVTPVWVDGITQLLNITYQATDIGQTYNQVLNAKVTPSGAPPPTLPAPPAPYASPSGFADDITTYLAAQSGSEAGIALARMFQNINPNVSGAATGVVVAGQSGPTYASNDPDYEYNWVRDSSLTMDVVVSLYNAATNNSAKLQYLNTLLQYASARATEQNDPNLQTGLGEPKFNLDNSIFTGPWGRPQNDGPATAAITLIEFATAWMKNGASISQVQQYLYDSTNHPSTAPVQKDLLFVASNWSTSSFDLWEEESSDHFYTRMVQRRALALGAQFATQMNDANTAHILTAAEQALNATMSQFWNPGRQILLYEYGPVLRGKSSFLDVSVVLGLLHGFAGDSLYSYTNDEVQSTVVRLATSFISQYSVFNKTQSDSSGQTLGVPIGRYPEDIYTGTGTAPNGGNPWYLATAALAQYMWAASAEYTHLGNLRVTNVSKPFFNYFAPQTTLTVGTDYGSKTQQFQSVVNSLNGWGDAFMRTVKYYTPSGGHLAEEYNRDSGAPQGCPDLTWSYASILTAAIQRAATRNDTTFLPTLANFGFVPNK